MGAGPTGLLLANELGLAGVRTAVAERLPRRSGQSEALNLRPRTAEVLDCRGRLGPVWDRSLAPSASKRPLVSPGFPYGW